MRSAQITPIAGRITLMVATIIATTVVTGTPAASACACSAQTPEAAIATHEVVFIGQLTDPTPRDESTWDGTWTFDVTGLVKGEVSNRVVVAGEGWGEGCGTDYSALPQPTVVLARRDGDRVVAGSCTPTIDRAEIDGLLSPLRAPSGEGEVEALVALRHKWANLIALDGRGRVLSYGDIDRHPVAVAHCGETTAAVLHARDPNLSFVDLETMTVTGEAELFVDPVPTADLWCELSGSGADVWYASGSGLTTQTAVAGTPGAAGLQLFDDAAAAYVGPTGRIVVLRRDPGGPIEWLDRADLSVSSTTDLIETEAPLAAGFDRAGGRLAVVVSTSAEPAGPRSLGSGIALFEIAADGTAARTDTIALEPAADSWPRSLLWLDDTTIAVEYETLDSKLLDVISPDGELISRTDIGWGWGDAVLSRKLLRTRDGGLELIGRDGRSTALTPRPLELTAEPGYVTSVADGPVVPPLRPAPPRITPVEAELESLDEAADDVDPDDEGAVGRADSSGDAAGDTAAPTGRRSGLRRQIRDLALPVGLGVAALGIYLISRRIRSSPEPIDDRTRPR